jgi:hypothetical protein
MQQRQKSPSISLTEVHVTHACKMHACSRYLHATVNSQTSYGGQRGQGSSSQPVPVQSSVSIYSADAAGEIANHCNVAICLAAMNPSTCLGFVQLVLALALCSPIGYRLQGPAVPRRRRHGSNRPSASFADGYGYCRLHALMCA